MPRFLITRNVPAMTDEQIKAAGRVAKSVCDELGIVWIKSYYSAKDGKFYCEYEAPSIEAVYEHGRRAQMPVDAVALISNEFDPSMFK